MQLGALSLSLAVKDIRKSTAFHEGLRFSVMGGSGEEGWLILKNGDAVIGLFQGMFEKNMLTFNPGWNQSAEWLKDFQDIRELQQELKSKGYQFQSEADETSSGPASFVLIDPDGNPVLVDQHV